MFLKILQVSLHPNGHGDIEEDMLHNAKAFRTATVSFSTSILREASSSIQLQSGEEKS